MDQMFQRGWPVRSQISPCKICGGVSDDRTYISHGTSYIFPLNIIPLMFHNDFHLYTLYLPECQKGENFKSSELRCPFGNRIALNRKILSLLIIARINVVYSFLNIEWSFIQ
jgi:hypothetical protein